MVGAGDGAVEGAVGCGGGGGPGGGCQGGEEEKDGEAPGHGGSIYFRAGSAAVFDLNLAPYRLIVP